MLCSSSPSGIFRICRSYKLGHMLKLIETQRVRKHNDKNYEEEKADNRKQAEEEWK